MSLCFSNKFRSTYRFLEVKARLGLFLFSAGKLCTLQLPSTWLFLLSVTKATASKHFLLESSWLGQVKWINSFSSFLVFLVESEGEVVPCKMSTVLSAIRQDFALLIKIWKITFKISNSTVYTFAFELGGVCVGECGCVWVCVFSVGNRRQNVYLFLFERTDIDFRCTISSTCVLKFSIVF